MTGRKYEKKLYIEMDFDDALERFGTVDPAELPDNIKLSKKRRGPGSNKPPGGTDEKEALRSRQPRKGK